MIIIALMIYAIAIKFMYSKLNRVYRAGIQHQVQVDMRAQPRLKSVCASAQSDQSLNFPPEEMLDPWLPIERLSKTLIRLRIFAV